MRKWVEERRCDWTVNLNTRLFPDKLYSFQQNIVSLKVNTFVNSAGVCTQLPCRTRKHRCILGTSEVCKWNVWTHAASVSQYVGLVPWIQVVVVASWWQFYAGTVSYFQFQHSEFQQLILIPSILDLSLQPWLCLLQRTHLQTNPHCCYTRFSAHSIFI